MRRFLLAAVMFGTASGAHAADMPDLPVLRGASRGLSTVVGWQGYYVGGQAGYGRRTRTSTVRPATSMADVAGRTVDRKPNMDVSQWNRLGQGSGAAPALAPSPATTPSGTMSSSAWKRLPARQVRSARRASTGTQRIAGRYFRTSHGDLDVCDRRSSDFGYVPRARPVMSSGAFCPTCLSAPAWQCRHHRTASRCTRRISGRSGVRHLARPTAQHNHLIYGYSAGRRRRCHLVGGLFLRAEYEYHPLDVDVESNINTVRAGLGYKF